MGSTNAMLTQLIQDAVLKLCTQNVVFNKSLEIDGIICVSPGDEAKEIVVKMHRTIMKPNPVQETFNNASDWSSNMYSNSRSPRQPQDPPPFRQRPPIQQQRLPKVRNNIENTMSTPDQNTSTTFNTSHQATGVPSATLDTPGGVVGTSENVPCIKEEPAFTSSPKSLKRSISGSEDQDAPDHSADKQRKLEQNTDTTDNQNMENINIKQEKEEPITIELGDDDDEEEDGGGGYDEDSTAGASWMGDNTLDTSQDNMADQSSDPRHDSINLNQGHLEVGTVMHHGTDHLQSMMGLKRFLCQVCNRSFNRANVYNQHMRIHTGEKPYQCELCLKSFRQLATFNRHRKIHFRNKEQN